MLAATMLWEVAAFVVLAAAFEAWERLRPVRRLAWAPRGIDLLSFACAVLFAWLSRALIDAAMARLDLGLLIGALAWLRSLPTWQKLLLGFLFIDFTVYWLHRAQHACGVLWRTHRWHHTSEQVNWLSGFRTSLLHSFLYNVPQTVVAIGLLNLDVREAGLAFALGVFVQLWDHANANAKIGWLKLIFIRPQDHRLHHAAERARPANFGFVFSVWDRLFGTYADPHSMPADYRLGLVVTAPVAAVPRMLLGV
jgi:sterol desaturase/sphingolipid hydroxylase (fatty acid hydroxylase superfamily)